MIVNGGTYHGRALALGRELAAYVIAADLIDLKTFDPVLDSDFRATISDLLTTPTIDGPANLIECHEHRPNNWGTHCGASRVAVAAYLGDLAQLARVAQVFKGWLGDRGLVQAAILRRGGYQVFDWENRALLRAFRWLHTEAQYPATGDDTWQPHVVNYYYFDVPADLTAAKRRTAQY